jgi:L-ascorbate metabolism protein UlaG (beta-lactamase superfamily)
MFVFSLMTVGLSLAQGKYEEDTVKTSKGDLKITFIGHGTLMFAVGGKTIHVDPVSAMGDYSQLPKADLILVTHEHGDHLDLKAIKSIRTGETVVVASEACGKTVTDAAIMANGSVKDLGWVKIEAVPAYNISAAFHPKGRGNGYILTFGDKRVYVAGDTENIPEMKNFGRIDIAFLPMNLPYTMAPEMVAAAAQVIKPAILYPYHFGETDTSKLSALLSGSGIEVRIRKLK